MKEIKFANVYYFLLFTKLYFAKKKNHKKNRFFLVDKTPLERSSSLHIGDF